MPLTNGELMMNTIKIFKLDGALQCGMGKEISLEEMAEKLKAIGGEIIEQEKKIVPYMISTVCGAPTGSANVYTLSRESWDRIKEGFLGTLGFSIWVFDTPTLLVFKYDGTLQCGMGEEVELEIMAKELEDNKVSIHNQYKSNDGKDHIKMCGASTGNINVYEIDSVSLPVAQKLGFTYLINQEVIDAMSDKSDEAMQAANILSLDINEGDDPPFPWIIVRGERPPFPW